MEIANLFLSLGAMFAVGLIADQIGRRTMLPRVTLLLLAGVAAGHMGWVPTRVSDGYEFLSITALTFVAFVLGGSLKIDDLQRTGRQILSVSLAIVATTLVVVTLGLMAIGAPFNLAIVLAGIASATAPAATTDVIRQSGTNSNFTQTLAGIVAVDDAWGLLAFSLCLSAAMSGASEAADFSVIREIGGAVVLGLAIGLPGAALTGRINEGEPLEIEALALVFLTAGLAIFCEVSFLIAGMTAGATIVNRASHHDRAFHEIAHIQLPFMILFFFLAGASLEVGALSGIGALGTAYVSLRVIARLSGGWLGATIGKAPPEERRFYGLALLPQAGVAVGMALIAAQAMPAYGDQIIALTIGTTVAFEIVAPVLTLWSIRQVSNHPK